MVYSCVIDGTVAGTPVALSSADFFLSPSSSERRKAPKICRSKDLQQIPYGGFFLFFLASRVPRASPGNNFCRSPIFPQNAEGTSSQLLSTS
jgi:hypothetical protein